MRLPCNVPFSSYSELFVESIRVQPTYPTCIWRSRRGWSSSNFNVIFGIRKLESLGYRVWFYVRDPMFSRFDTIPECDRQRDRHTHTDTRRLHSIKIVKTLSPKRRKQTFRTNAMTMTWRIEDSNGEFSLLCGVCAPISKFQRTSTCTRGYLSVVNHYWRLKDTRLRQL